MSSPKPCRQKNGELSIAFAEWCSRAPGSRVVTLERAAIESMVDDLFGYQLLQVGELGDDMAHLSNCSIRRKTLITHRVKTDEQSVLVAEAPHLPIASDSVDVAILVHTLDFSPDPRQVLREIERVLIPEGRLIVIGFSPFSLWGMWRLFARWRGRVPWCGHFLSYPRLDDWLTLMGFKVEVLDVMEFRPPTRKARFDFIERTGRRFWPMLAGIYAVRAVKRVSRVTPIRERWSKLRVVGSRVIEPTVRTSFKK